MVRLQPGPGCVTITPQSKSREGTNQRKAMNTDKGRYDTIDRVSVWLAGATALTGLIRMLYVKPLADGLNDTTLKFFAVAGALLLLRKIKSLSFGDYKAEFAEAVETANEALEEAKTASSMTRYLGTKSDDEPTAR